MKQTIAIQIVFVCALVYTFLYARFLNLWGAASWLQDLCVHVHTCIWYPPYICLIVVMVSKIIFCVFLNEDTSARRILYTCSSILHFICFSFTLFYHGDAYNNKRLSRWEISRNSGWGMSLGLVPIACPVRRPCLKSELDVNGYGIVREWVNWLIEVKSKGVPYDAFVKAKFGKQQILN